MGQYILKRLLLAVPILLGISLFTFFLIRLVPGDTVTAMLGPHYHEEQAILLRTRYGLNQPLTTQYVIWIQGVLQGDLGFSHFTGQPVLTAILERFPVTLELAFFSLLFAIILAIPLGTVAAVKRARLPDYLASLVGLVGISIPGFWLGTLLLLIFSLSLGYFPSGGFVPLQENLWANIRHLLLPGISLGTAVTAVVMRMSRSAMLEVLNQDYIKVARAKGMGEQVVIFRHALKNAMIPIITILGIQAGYLMGGSVVIEYVFSLPGIGRLALMAISNRDYMLLQGIILFIASAFVFINLLVDILYAFINPKIRY